MQTTALWQEWRRGSIGAHSADLSQDINELIKPDVCFFIEEREEHRLRTRQLQ